MSDIAQCGERGRLLAPLEHNEYWINYTEIGGLVEFGILGPTELINRGEIVPLGPAKQRGMLAILLYHAGEFVRTDTVIDHLWEPQGRTDRRPTLYSLTSRLRA